MLSLLQYYFIRILINHRTFESILRLIPVDEFYAMLIIITNCRPWALNCS